MTIEDKREWNKGRSQNTCNNFIITRASVHGNAGQRKKGMKDKVCNNIECKDGLGTEDCLENRIFFSIFYEIIKTVNGN
jgi:hypothetical protein